MIVFHLLYSSCKIHVVGLIFLLLLCRVDSRKDLVLWMCEQHNLVNKKLHKPIFPCDMRLLDERWRLGAQECWEGEKLDDEDASGQE
mmetsp:Transcript_24922/g.41547  ORF Transcript_24922/g.41547 Transcript_24922/m.41547 type:complete len:87 (+) Transcript_24922:587-847(+)